MGRVGANDPQTTDLPTQDPLDDLVVGPTVFGRNQRCIDPQHTGNRVSVRGIAKVMPAQQVGRVAEQPRSHRVALAGDRVRSGTRTADAAGHQCEVDDCLSGPGALVTLVDSHRPPERDSLATGNQFGKRFDLRRLETRVASDAFDRVAGHMSGKRFEPAGVSGDEIAIHRIGIDQQFGHSIQQRHVRLG